MMTNGDRNGRIYLSNPHTNIGFFFLHTIKYSIFIFKKGFPEVLITLDATYIERRLSLPCM